MKARFAAVSALLVLAAPVARANEQTASVKDPLASVRVQLTHYDLEPQGTLTVLPQLAALMHSLRGTPEAAEAAFLRAAAANDLLYLAEFFGRDALRAGLAAEFKVAPDALPGAIAAELRACAQGVYREPAIAALASLERKEAAGQAPVGSSDLRRDAKFVHAAASLAKNDSASASAGGGRETGNGISDRTRASDVQPAPSTASRATDQALSRRDVPAALSAGSLATVGARSHTDAEPATFAVPLVTDLFPRRDSWAAFFATPLTTGAALPRGDAWSASFATSATLKALPRRDAQPASFAASLAIDEALRQRSTSSASIPTASVATEPAARDNASITTTHSAIAATDSIARGDSSSAPATTAPSANRALAARDPSTATPPALAAHETIGGRFAPLIDDPCSPKSCPAPYADFDVEARRAYAYLQQLSAAALRIEQAKGLGDPLFEVLASELERDIATLRTLVLRLAPKVPGDRRLLTPTSLPAWPAPHVIVFARATELVYARTQQVRIGAKGDVEQVEYPAPTASVAQAAAKASSGADASTTQPSAAELAPAPVFPATNSIKYDANDTGLATRSIDDLVTAIRNLRGDEPALRAWLVADAGITAQLPARALVSLRKAGAKEMFFAATTKDGTLVASPIRLVIATVDSETQNPDLKLRVRLGGYTLDLGRGVTDIPRVRDDAGWQFDVAALHSQVRGRPPRTAAVSFMTDVAVDQLLRAVQEVAPSRAPIDLVIQ